MPKTVKTKERPRTQTERTQMSQSSSKVLGGSVHTDNLPPMVQVTDESDNETPCLISKAG